MFIVDLLRNKIPISKSFSYITDLTAVLCFNVAKLTWYAYELGSKYSWAVCITYTEFINMRV